jgi:glycosyltransferase involved in cell wall biosynthesis
MSEACEIADCLVVVPALNEGRRIAAVVMGVRSAESDVSVLVIDDGSSDDTAEQARRHGAVVVSHPFNLGYGTALQTGYKYADRHGYRFVDQMDADGQHDPSDVPRLLAPLRTGVADVVVGSRFVRPTSYRMGAARSTGRVVFQSVLRACGGPHITDPTSGFQGLTRPAFRFCCADFYPSDFPDIDVLLVLSRQGFRIVEVPVEMAPSPAKTAPLHGGLRAVYYTYKMLLSTFRSMFIPRMGRAPDAARGGSHKELSHGRPSD